MGRLAAAAALVLAVALPLGAVAALPGFLFASLRSPVVPPPADLPVKPVHFKARDGVDLVAWSVEAEAPKATVIIAHGLGANRGDSLADLYGLTRDLLGRNYSVLALDLRGHGQSAAGARHLSGGLDEALDLIAAADFVAAQAPGRRIAALGIDLGGAAALAATAADSRFEALVAMDVFAAPDPFETEALRLRSQWPAALVDLGLWSARHVWGEGPGMFRPADIARLLAGRPALFIQSGGDRLVPLADGQALARAAGDAALWVTPAPAIDNPILLAGGVWGSHGRAYALFREEWVETVAAFLDRRFATMFG